MPNTTRFQDTERELSICEAALNRDPLLVRLRGDELRCALRLIQKCRDIAEIYKNTDLESMWIKHTGK